MKKLTTHISLVAVLAIITLTVSFAGWRAQAERRAGRKPELKNAAAAPVKVAPAPPMFATITVTNTNNSGGGSLRQAILDSNASVGVLDAIEFNLGAGTPSIALTSSLPDITDPVTINGNTGGSTRVELNGAAAGANVNGLTIRAGNTTIAGLVINRFKSSTNSEFGNGISIRANGGNTIINCYIGTDATGTVARGNTFDGMRLNFAPNNTIGGITAGERNVISGNGRVGIYIINNVGATAIGNKVIGNFIGRNATDTADLGNGLSGVSIEGAANNTIGGTSAAERNIISGNNDTGVTIFGGASTSGNAILGNSIFNNTKPGIELASPSGVNPNDAGDGDTGANGLQNFPVLTCWTNVGGATTINGTLNSLATTMFRIEYFVNDACDASGNGEGQTFLSAQTVTTDASGNAPLNVTFASAFAIGKVITATATRLDAMGNPVETSEFSQCLAIGAPPTLTISDVTLAEGNAGTTNFVFTVTLSGAQNYCSPVMVNYATANDTATAGSDYTATSGTLTFTAPHASNSVTQTITVPVTGETMIESNETFFVYLSGATNAGIADDQGLGTITNDDLPPFKVEIGDPLLCLTAGGLVGVTVTITNPNAAAVNAAFTATLPTTLNGLPGTGLASVNPGGITVTASAVTWTGSIPANTTMTITYKARIAGGTPADQPLCVNSEVVFNGGPKATVQECKTLNCPVNGIVKVSDQKPGSVLVFPYYISKAAEKKDTRMTITNSFDKPITAHVFFIDGATCQQADQFLCLTPYASFTFKASEYDPEATGWLLVVAVDATGRPTQANGLIGNAFVNDGEYVDNYGAEAFRANSSLLATVTAETATLFFDNQSYDVVPNQLAAEIQSPLDAPNQRVITVGLQGDLTRSTLSGAAQSGTGLLINGNEKPTGSFVSWLNGGCQAQALINATSPRVPNGMNGMIPKGQVGTMQWRIGAGVGLLMTPRTAPWSGIRNLHKTGSTTTTLTIPRLAPVC